jgi:hypothetical protein
VRLFTFFIDKRELGAARVTIGDGQAVPVETPAGSPYVAASRSLARVYGGIPDEPTKEVPLAWLAHARSGDKGNSSNIAIIAREPRFLPLLRRELTPERVVQALGALAEGPAERFEAPGLNALNFLIQNALGGGGMASLRIDPQGKAYGQMALEMPIATPVSWLETPAAADPSHE